VLVTFYEMASLKSDNYIKEGHCFWKIIFHDANSMYFLHSEKIIQMPLKSANANQSKFYFAKLRFKKFAIKHITNFSFDIGCMP